MEINYIRGDALKPVGDGPKIIVHCVNCLGVMGSGIALAIKNKWPNVYSAYNRWAIMVHRDNIHNMLGDIQVIKAEENVYVCNLAGQLSCGNEVIGDVSIPAVDYRAMHKGFAALKLFLYPTINKELYAQYNEASLHMGRIGSVRAGGSWDRIEEILNNVFGNTDIKIYVYDL